MERAVWWGNMWSYGPQWVFLFHPFSHFAVIASHDSMDIGKLIFFFTQTTGSSMTTTSSSGSTESEPDMMMMSGGAEETSSISGTTTTEELQFNQMNDSFADEEDCPCILSPGALIAVVITSGLLGICLIVWAVSYCTKKKALAAATPVLTPKVLDEDLEVATTHSDSPSTEDDL
jgi:hypothetical protein